MLFTFSPDAYDPGQAPTLRRPGRLLRSGGDGQPLQRDSRGGKDSPHGRAIYAADKNNLQPRIGAAWDPVGAGRLIVRAGYGMYFDQTQVGMVAQNVQESSITTRFARMSSSATHRSRTPAQRHGHRALRGPHTCTRSRPATGLWRLGGSTGTSACSDACYSRGMIDAGYVGSRGDHLLRYVDINRPQPADLAGHGPSPNLVRPFLGYDSIFMRETTARSRYHGFVASFRHEAGRVGVRDRELHLQSKQGGRDLRQRRDRRPPESAGQGRRVCRGAHGPNPHLHRVLRVRTAVCSRSDTRLAREPCWEGGRSPGSPESNPARPLECRSPIATTTTGVSRRHCGPTRSAIRRPATRPACSGSTRRRSSPSPAR